MIKKTFLNYSLQYNFLSSSSLHLGTPYLIRYNNTVEFINTVINYFFIYVYLAQNLNFNYRISVLRN